MTPEKLAVAKMLLAEGRSISEIAAIIEVSRGTLYRHTWAPPARGQAGGLDRTDRWVMAHGDTGAGWCT